MPVSMPPLAQPCFFINNIYWPYFKVIQVYLSPLNDISNGMKILREEKKHESFFLRTFQVHSKKVESVGALCRPLVCYHRVLICHFSNCTAHTYICRNIQVDLSTSLQAELTTSMNETELPLFFARWTMGIAIDRKRRTHNKKSHSTHDF